MKLPTAQFPDTLQEIKRQSVKPLKRLSGRPIKNILNRVQTQFEGKNPFKSSPSVSDVKASKGSKLLLNLLLVRPWVLVLGLWLVSMATGTLALNGMLSPRKLRMALPEPALESATSTQSNTLLKTDQAADSTVETAVETETAAETSVIEIGGGDAKESGSGFPMLPLVALVGSCAAGSLVISRRRAMVRLAAARAQGRKRRSRPSNREANSPVGAPARTVKEKATPAKRRQRARRSVIAKKPAMKPAVASGNRVLASRTTAQTQNTSQPRKAQKSVPRVVQKVASSMRSAPTRPAARGAAPARPASRVSRSQARRSAMRAASRRQPLVSVVPANESHALDWTQGSLAHQLDVRPQRSAM